jgi:hypothetical protein
MERTQHSIEAGRLQRAWQRPPSSHTPLSFRSMNQRPSLKIATSNVPSPIEGYTALHVAMVRGEVEMMRALGWRIC